MAASITWHVYQFRSDSELLYVGYTRWLAKRIAQHRRGKSWWPEVTDIRSEEFGTEDEARQREKELWADSRPKYNRQCPFRTPEELRAMARENTLQHRRTPEQRELRAAQEATPEFRAQERARDRTPERREQKRRQKQTPQYRAYMREYNKRRKFTTARRWRQTGPGLF